MKNRQAKPFDLFLWLAATACKRVLVAGGLKVGVRWRGKTAEGVAVAGPSDKAEVEAADWGTGAWELDETAAPDWWGFLTVSGGRSVRRLVWD